MNKRYRFILQVGLIATIALINPTYAGPNIDTSSSSPVQTITGDIIRQVATNNDNTFNILRQLKYNNGSLSEINESYTPIGSTVPTATLVQSFNTRHELTNFSYRYINFNESLSPFGADGSSPGGTRFMPQSPFPITTPPALGSSALGSGLIWPVNSQNPPTQFGFAPLAPGLPAAIDVDTVEHIAMASGNASGLDLPQCHFQIGGSSYGLTGDYVNFTVPQTAGNAIPFLLTKPDGNPFAIGCLPSFPAGQLNYDMVTPLPKLNDYIFPKFGQAGKPITVYGPFNGEYKDFKFVFNGDPVPMKTITGLSATLEMPANIFGTTNLHIFKDNIDYKASYASLGIKLIGNDRILKPGESDMFTLKVMGLENATSPVTVYLEDLNPDIVSMNGGASQTYVTPPGAKDSVSQNYGLLGVKKGAADIVAWIPQGYYEPGPTTIDKGTTGPTTVAKGPGPVTHGPDDGNNPPHTPPDGTNISTHHDDNVRKPWLEDGWLEPSQGVWQDDDRFADKPTKQITKLAPASWKAELRMVQGRATRIFGLRDSKHDEIHIKGGTYGSTEVPVRFRFTLYQNGLPPQIIYTEKTSHNKLYLDGPPGKARRFDAVLTSHTGVGTDDNKAFTFKNTGGYKIVAELIKPDDSPTGLTAAVEGEVVHTLSPKVYFKGIMLFDPEHESVMSQLSLLHTYSETLAYNSQGIIPLWYPLIENGFIAQAEPSLDEREGIHRLQKALINAEDVDYDNARADHMTAVLGITLSKMARLEKISRIFGVMDDSEFDTLGHKNAVAFTVNQKVIFIRRGETVDTVAHEFVHTTPFLWSGDQMVDLFGFSYHNTKDNKCAYGAEIRMDGTCRRKDGFMPIMGSSSDMAAQWITQGTYWHLIDEFLAPHDPKVMTITATISNLKGKQSAELSPIYTEDGVVDMAEGPIKDWGIVLKNASGTILGQYPFTPQWQLADTDRPNVELPITYQIPDLPGAATIEIVGGGETLTSRQLSAQTPRISISEPRANSTAIPVKNHISVSWTAEDPGKLPLLYTVLFSPNNGDDWHVMSLEQTTTSFNMPLDYKPIKPRIRVVATNGSRSSQAEIGLTIKE